MSLSLNSALRTCKVNTGEANRIESDRFLNPNNMVCIPWSGMNSKGQTVCADSYNTKRAGCNSALDRVTVENAIMRPGYSDYISLNMAGLQGDIYGNDSARDETNSAAKWEQERYKFTGSFGNQFQSTNYQTCGIGAYENAMARMSQGDRQAAAMNNGYTQNQYRLDSGFGH
jgi:hypothetical protein